MYPTIYEIILHNIERRLNSIQQKLNEGLLNNLELLSEAQLLYDYDNNNLQKHNAIRANPLGGGISNELIQNMIGSKHFNIGMFRFFNSAHDLFSRLNFFSRLPDSHDLSFFFFQQFRGEAAYQLEAVREERYQQNRTRVQQALLNLENLPVALLGDNNELVTLIRRAGLRGRYMASDPPYFDILCETFENLGSAYIGAQFGENDNRLETIFTIMQAVRLIIPRRKEPGILIYSILNALAISAIQISGSPETIRYLDGNPDNNFLVENRTYSLLIIGFMLILLYFRTNLYSVCDHYGLLKYYFNFIEALSRCFSYVFNGIETFYRTYSLELMTGVEAVYRSNMLIAFWGERNNELEITYILLLYLFVFLLRLVVRARSNSLFWWGGMHLAWSFLFNVMFIKATFFDNTCIRFFSGIISFSSSFWFELEQEHFNPVSTLASQFQLRGERLLLSIRLIMPMLDIEARQPNEAQEDPENEGHN